MKSRLVHRDLSRVVVLLTALLACFLLPETAPAQTQKITSLTATAKGQGTITVSDPGVEVRKRPLYSVVVTLRENGDAEIVVVTDMQLMARGKWTQPSDLSQGIALKITGGTVANNAKGTGKLFLRPDGKTIDKLNFEATSTARSKVTVDFVAEKENTN
jgi:hypothetical protein